MGAIVAGPSDSFPDIGWGDGVPDSTQGLPDFLNAAISPGDVEASGMGQFNYLSNITQPSDVVTMASAENYPSVSPGAETSATAAAGMNDYHN